MEVQGIGVGRGIAVGSVLVMPEPLPEPAELSHDGDAIAEKERVRAAVSAVAAELQERAERADGPAREVIEAAIQMAQDPMLADDVNERIDAGTAGERAVFEAVRTFQQKFIALGGYMAERAADLGDISQRIVAQLLGIPVPVVPDSAEPFVLIARDLAPADTALIDLDKVLALITREGGPTSHTAILARAKSIPAVVGIGADAILTAGARVIVDAASGVVIVDPSTKAVTAAKKQIAVRAERDAAPITQGALADGTKVPLFANLGSPSEATEARELGAEGVGLFRTEFLFLDAKVAPTVEEQQAQYTELLRHFPGRRVIVRVLDAGADKPLSFLDDSPEPNPALGLRGLRALRAASPVLHDQLTALKGAQDATEAELWVMAPMVADAEEASFFVDAGRDLGLTTVGVMAEVPSLAVVADQVFAIADFVSIGTNDLTQYTLAADRLLSSVASYQDPWHPAVLRLIKLLGDAGADAHKSVGVCGEAAADPQLAVVLVGLGVTTLSMAPSALAAVRQELASVTLDQARAKASAAIEASTAAAAREAAAAG